MAVRRFQATLTPAIVATIVTAEQAFTAGPGNLNINAAFVGVSKPTHQSGGMPVQVRVSSATQVAITFVNPTAAGVTPTAAEVYQFVVID
jgi:hypothetical protein